MEGERSGRHRCGQRIAALAALAVVSVVSSGPIAKADPAGQIGCQVPSGQYPTLQSAIDDPGCVEIELAAGDFVGPFRVDRQLEIRGAGTTFESRLLGRFEIEGDAEVRVEFVRLEIDPSVGSLFADDFETGDSSAWSSTVP